MKPQQRLLQFIYRYIATLILVIYTMSIGLATKKARLLLRYIIDLYKCPFVDDAIYTSLPILPFDAVISKDDLIYLVESHAKDGNITLEELCIINGIIKKDNPKHIFEFGTFDGRTTINMALNSDDTCIIYTLDLPSQYLSNTQFQLCNYDKILANKTTIGERIANSRFFKEQSKIRQLYGDSASFDFTALYGMIDFVFVDAAHDYNNALSDSHNALKLIGDRSGTIIWHDYRNHCEVVPALNRLKQLYSQLNIYHIDGTSLAYCRIEPGAICQRI